MQRPVEYIAERIEVLNAMHGKKIRKNLASFGEGYYLVADGFFERYLAILAAEGKTLDYAIDCYLQMIADMNSETVEFLRSGSYTSSTFQEVNERVYARPEIMEYYMHGLILSQFLWKHHYGMFDYFISHFPQYAGSARSYLEVGVGHGFQLSKVMGVLDEAVEVMAMDISETSIKLAKSFVDNDRVDYRLQDILTYDEDRKFDLIVLGEVLEHVERPLELLVKLHGLLAPDGVFYFTTPTNAPAIDHIYLFNTVDEVREMVDQAGFHVESELFLASEDVSPERAAKFKIAMLYGAFLTKRRRD
jgi:2-polyprenyl-3-methyl-5-hydroxy-6-metoxy-1,4-benzoquinol methylase